MIEIGKQLVSFEVVKEHFVCDLTACKGACCVEGDAGAPLTDDEVEILDREYESIRPELRSEGIAAIEEHGTHMRDDDGEWVTPLIDGKECAFTLFDENGTAKCGIEQAWQKGATTFQKPISCHLYPIRTKKFEQFEAVNYERWHICNPACSLGEALAVPVYKFTRDALIRKYGEAWYQELDDAALALKKLDKSDQPPK